MASRDTILRAIRDHGAPVVDLPATPSYGIEYENPVAQFSEVLEAVGGRAMCIAQREELGERIAGLDVYQRAEKIFSTLPEVSRANVDLAAVDDARSMNNLDLAVLPGEIAVAENAAVWVTDEGIAHRVVYFIAEHLILVVDAARLVHNMHQAYELLQFDRPQYGVFVSGPSKTADIEQSLVIGAQGPRSLHVVLVGTCRAE